MRRLFAIWLTSLAVLGAPAPARSQNAGGVAQPGFLYQSWNDDDRSWFYTTTQGSQIMPYAWFMSLERPGSGDLFTADRLARFGYLPNPFDAGRWKARNPDGLPIGFVKDVDDRGEWIGMTCAACHTGRMTFRDRPIQVDGAPAGADMFAFIKELGEAMAATAGDPAGEKFGRFAGRVLGARTSESDRARLFRNLKAASDEFDAYVKASTSPVAWGPARLDAFGMIFNRATAIDLRDPSNNHPPDAPVSYPFLWDTSYHDWVQWNGSAPNTKTVERLGRNVGEVFGVFAHTDIGRDALPLYYPTSIKRVNLLAIEARLRKLTAPRWPNDLAPIDRAKAEAGRALYGRYCLGCHALAKTGANREQSVVLTPLAEIGTDPVMATNAATREAATGVIEGVRMPFLLTTKPLPARTKSLDLVANLVAGAILQPINPLEPLQGLASDQTLLLAAITKQGAATTRIANILLDVADPVGGKGLAKLFLERKEKGERDLLVYKARPLDGIWATAPYLHNGSVPNLYQLLVPAAQRAATFGVGSRVFDPVAVGFATDAGPFSFDTALRGNSNKGHEGPRYGTDRLSEKERWDLVEYLKTL